MAVGVAETARDVVDIDFLSTVTEDPIALSLMQDLNARRPMDRGAYVTAFTSRYNRDRAGGAPTTPNYVDRMIGVLVRRGVFGTTPTPDGEQVYVNGGQHALFRALGSYTVESGRITRKPNGHPTPRSQIPDLKPT